MARKTKPASSISKRSRRFRKFRPAGIPTHFFTNRRAARSGSSAAAENAQPSSRHRLIVGCGNSKMLLVDSTSGKVVQAIDCGAGVDAAAFDPGTHLGYVSAGGSGTVTAAKVEADKLTVVQTLTTERGARTMT